MVQIKTVPKTGLSKKCINDLPLKKEKILKIFENSLMARRTPSKKNLSERWSLGGPHTIPLSYAQEQVIRRSNTQANEGNERSEGSDTMTIPHIEVISVEKFGAFQWERSSLYKIIVWDICSNCVSITAIIIPLIGVIWN